MASVGCCGRDPARQTQDDESQATSSPWGQQALPPCSKFVCCESTVPVSERVTDEDHGQTDSDNSLEQLSLGEVTRLGEMWSIWHGS